MTNEEWLKQIAVKLIRQNTLNRWALLGLFLWNVVLTTLWFTR